MNENDHLDLFEKNMKIEVSDEKPSSLLSGHINKIRKAVTEVNPVLLQTMKDMKKIRECESKNKDKSLKDLKREMSKISKNSKSVARPIIPGIIGRTWSCAFPREREESDLKEIAVLRDPETGSRPEEKRSQEKFDMAAKDSENCLQQILEDDIYSETLPNCALAESALTPENLSNACVFDKELVTEKERNSAVTIVRNAECLVPSSDLSRKTTDQISTKVCGSNESKQDTLNWEDSVLTLFLNSNSQNQMRTEDEQGTEEEGFQCCGYLWKDDYISFISHIKDEHDLSEELGKLFWSLLTSTHSKDGKFLCRTLLACFEIEARSERTLFQNQIIALDAKVEDLQLLITRYNKTLVVVEAELKNTKECLDQVQHEAMGFKEDNKRISMELNNQAMQWNEERQETIYFQEESLRLKNENQNLIGENLDLIRKIKDDEESKLLLEKQLSDEKAKFIHAVNEVRRIEDVVHCMTAKLDSNTELQHAVITETENKDKHLRECQHRITNITTEFTSLEQKNQALLKELESKNQQLSEMFDKMTTAEEEIENSRSNSDALYLEIENLQKIIASQKEDISLTRKMNSDYISRIEELEICNKTLQQEIQHERLKHQEEVQRLEENIEKKDNLFREEAKKFHYIKTLLNSTDDKENSDAASFGISRFGKTEKEGSSIFQCSGAASEDRLRVEPLPTQSTVEAGPTVSTISTFHRYLDSLP